MGSGPRIRRYHHVTRSSGWNGHEATARLDGDRDRDLNPVADLRLSRTRGRVLSHAPSSTWTATRPPARPSRRICTEAGVGDGRTPRELRTTFVSLMSHQGVSIEEIARLAGHATIRSTKVVYRREPRPVITTGAEIMDQLFTGT
jgi:integrase